jgi:hypothetical protein
MSSVLEDGLVYVCCEDRRRAELREPSATLNGIDFLEVVDAGALPPDRQRVLRVNFVRTPPGVTVAKENVRITGGERIREIPIDDAAFVDDVLVVRVATPGDFSTYTLRLIELGGTPLSGLDPLLSAVDFSFKVECPTDFDCHPVCSCPPAERDDPPIDYTVKDYESFRRLMLDRLALVAPEWTERSPADLGVALVELVAYVADYLSYEQDAVATEAYLGTARRRVSMRRHATLLDYPIHDGCNARVFVHLRAKGTAAVTVPAKSRLLTELPGQGAVLDTVAYEKTLDERPAPEVFETMDEVTIRAEHDELALYAWGERECCLPEGATRATLAGRWEDLHKGDLLVFEEVIGPRTGQEADADPTRRHVVRLSVEPALLEDPLFPDPDDPTDTNKHQPVTQIEWAVEDALPFPLCISGRTDAQHGRRYVDGLTVARGNVVLADHGRTTGEDEPIEGPPAPRPGPRRDSCDRCGGALDATVPARFAPRLSKGPLTHAARVTRTAVVDGRRQRLFFDPDKPAAAAMTWELSRVLPVISIEDANGRRWLPQRDLLSSDPFAPEFVAEVDDDGDATLRFGDGEHGARPAPGVSLDPTYRVGNGAAGNVGAGSIRHVVLDDPGLAAGIEAVRNPLSARGGTDAESLERVRVDAPDAFKTLDRAVTPEDYATIAQRHPQVQRAQATMRWTGSWRTVYLTVDRLGGRSVERNFEAALRAHLERFRMAGHDLEIDGPRFVALELVLEVCVQPGYFRSDVAAALLEVLGSRTLPDGRRGHFHPDNLTFGQSVLLSPIVAAAAAVPGVRDVQAVTCQRLGVESRTAIDEGALAIGRLEIPRLDNDPNFPERGVLTLDLRGGR